MRYFFLRNRKHEVVYTSDESKGLITKWLESAGWKFENFADFIQLIGVKTPIHVGELNAEKQSIKCITALNTEAEISLRFGDWVDFSSEIWITEGEETRKYRTNGNETNGITMPQAILESRAIKRNDGKELISIYSRYYCHRTLKLDDTHSLKVQIDEPNKYDIKSEVAVLRNCADIESYLLGLDKSLDLPKVYENVMKLLQFSDEDTSNSRKILFSYEIEKQVRSKILLSYGKMQEYAIFENGETFHVFKNGNWSYLSDTIQVSSSSETKRFTVIGTMGNLIKANSSEIMDHVEKKISELWKFVRKQ